MRMPPKNSQIGNKNLNGLLLFICSYCSLRRVVISRKHIPSFGKFFFVSGGDFVVLRSTFWLPPEHHPTIHLPPFHSIVFSPLLIKRLLTQVDPPRIPSSSCSIVLNGVWRREKSVVGLISVLLNSW